MQTLIVIASLSTLIGACLFEMLCLSRGLVVSQAAAFLTAVGFGTLGIRLGYLVVMDDLGRLSVWGTLPIFCIAFARVLACGVLLRRPR